MPRLLSRARWEDIVASDGIPPNNSMQRTALRAAADAERWADPRRHCANPRSRMASRCAVPGVRTRILAPVGCLSGLCTHRGCVCRGRECVRQSCEGVGAGRFKPGTHALPFVLEARPGEVSKCSVTGNPGGWIAAGRL